MSTAGGGGVASSNHRMFLRLKPRGGIKALGRRGHPRAAAEAREGAGHPLLRAEPAHINTGRPGRRRASTSSRCRAATSRLPEASAALVSKLQDDEHLQDVDERPADPAIRRCTVDIDRDRAASLGVTALQDRAGAVRGVRLVALGLDDLHAERPVQVIMELMPPSSARSVGARAAVGALEDRQPRAARHGRAKFSRAVGPLSVNHAGQIPSVTVSFNLKPNVSLGEGQAVEKTARAVLPADHQHELLGHRRCSSRASRA